MTPTEGRGDEISREEFDDRFEEFARELNDGRSVADVGGDENLFDAGVLDSFSVVKLIRLLEQMVGGPIDLTEASIESFATTNLIYRTFVQRSPVAASGASGD